MNGLGNYNEPANSSGALGMIIRNETDGVSMNTPLDSLDHPGIQYGGVMTSMEGMLVTFERDKTTFDLDLTECLDKVKDETFFSITLCGYIALGFMGFMILVLENRKATFRNAIK